nr:glycerol-3-phosphate dehydrogenase [Haloechinothrix sp. LS1_15]
MNADYRTRALRDLGERTVDVLVVGGGVVGTGAALDAASRGLSVALLEARDWAAGTSSRSSKLIHGGLRYLEQRDFGLVAEALRERGLLLRKLAPHLVRPVPFVLPLHNGVTERAYIGAGVLLYDTMGGARALPKHRHLSRGDALEHAPALRPDALTGAIRYYDAQVDDARHTMTLARTAAQHGATVLTRTRVTRYLRENGRVTGAVARDTEGDREIVIRANRVINATGVWTDEMHEAAGAQPPFRVRMSKGVHLLVPRQRIAMDTGMIMRTEKSVLFVIPWGQHWIIGTTDTDWRYDKEHPAASKADVDYLLATVNTVLRDPLTTEDIEGVYAGLRPLLAGTSDDTATLSREHAVAEPIGGLTVVAGGKYTTYRVMAADAVDHAIAGLGRSMSPSLTDKLPLVGAIGFHEMWQQRQAVADRAELPLAMVEHLLGRYGSATGELLEMIAAEPGLAEPLPGAPAYHRAEVRYAVTHEGAMHLEDVLTRRTRISVEQFDRGTTAARPVAEMMGEVLGWSAERVDAEVSHYCERVHAERRAQQAPDDAAANAARLAAPEVATSGAHRAG